MKEREEENTFEIEQTSIIVLLCLTFSYIYWGFQESNGTFHGNINY